VGEDLPGELLAYARRNNVTQIVIGRSRESWWRQFFRRSLANELIRRSEGIPVHIVVPEQDAPRVFRLPGVPLPWRAWFYPPVSVAVVVALGFAASAISTLPNMAMLFLTLSLARCVSAYGRRSQPRCLHFRWNFTEPYYTFRFRGTIC
jgi:two-component system sensor histidine kinase KdpD